MRITYVRIFVTDLAAARKFYAQTLGLDILWEYENKAIGFDLGPVLIVEDVSSEEDCCRRHSPKYFFISAIRPSRSSGRRMP